MEFSQYVARHLSDVGNPPKDILERWNGRIVAQQMDKQAPDVCVSTYMSRYGKGIASPKVIALAKCAEFKGRHEIAVAFLKEAYRIEYRVEPVEDVPNTFPTPVEPIVAEGPASDKAGESGYRQARGVLSRGNDAEPPESIIRRFRDGVEQPVLFGDATVEVVVEQTPLLKAMMEAQVSDVPFPVEPGSLVTMQPVDPVIDIEVARQMAILDPAFWGQPKRDGKRLVVFATGSQVIYQSRCSAEGTGSLWAMPDLAMDSALLKVAGEMGPFILDGELLYYDTAKGEHRTAPQAATRNVELGDPAGLTRPTFAIFKALFAEGMDLRDRAEWERIVAGEAIGKALMEAVALDIRFPGEVCFEVVPTSRTEEEKRALVARQQAENREGEVWIKRNTPYLPGKTNPIIGREGRQAVYDPPMFRTKYYQDWMLLVTGLSKSGATKVERLFAAIQVAKVESDGSLTPMGSVGTGFTLEDQYEIKRRFETGEPLFVDVMSAGLTEQGVLWHPRLQRISTDRPE